MADKAKIVVVVNKSWEFDPFYHALISPTLRPTDLLSPTKEYPVPTGQHMSDPRAEINGFKYLDVTLRCVENMMDPNVNKSNSERKLDYMPELLQWDNPNLVISVSTAESTPEAQRDTKDEKKSINASVIIGGNFFMYDAKQFDPTSESNLNIPEKFRFFSELDLSPLYELVTPEFSKRCTDKFLTAKNAVADELLCVANNGLASVGVVNIMDYKAYEKGDPAAYNAFHDGSYPCIPVCIETTHGIVNMAVNSNRPDSPIPVVFVSPITDRYECFDDDVTPIQNYICGFNAGIAVAELLMELNNYYGTLNG